MQAHDADASGDARSAGTFAGAATAAKKWSPWAWGFCRDDRAAAARVMRARRAPGRRLRGGLRRGPSLGGRTSRRHGDLDAADADANERADLEQLETDGAAGGLGERGIVQADAAQGAQQHIGHRVEPQAQLVGAHRGGRGAVRIEIELALLDPVLHLAAGAVDLLVEMLGLALVAPQRGDDEARIGLALASTRPWRRPGAGGSSSCASST